MKILRLSIQIIQGIYITKPKLERRKTICVKRIYDNITIDKYPEIFVDFFLRFAGVSGTLTKDGTFILFRAAVGSSAHDDPHQNGDNNGADVEDQAQ